MGFSNYRFLLEDAGVSFHSAQPVSVTLASLFVWLCSSSARGRHHLASFCCGCKSTQEVQVLICDAVQWYYIKVFCTEILGGDLKSKYMVFLWLDVLITVSQQYLLMWVTVIKALWAYLTVNVLWLFSISSPRILNCWAVSSLFISTWTPARRAELCRVRGTRRCLPRGAQVQKARRAGRGSGELGQSQLIAHSVAEFNLDTLCEGRFQDQVKYSSSLSSIVNFQVGRAEWIALYPKM